MAQQLTPEKRRILQKQFEHASKMAASGNYDYATDLFFNCVVGDPGNRIYVQNYLGNLHRKYSDNKKGARMAKIKGAGVKTGIMTANKKKDWPGVIKHGLEFLKLNPWDKGALFAMSDACDALELEDCRIEYLKSALAGDMRDAETNRRLARAMEDAGDYDGATLCWQRVLAENKADDEARKGIANCQVKNTIRSGKYEEAETSGDVRADKQGRGGEQLSEEQKIQKAIKKNPEDVGLYIELADILIRKESLEEAEGMLEKALEVSGGEVNVRERLEDVQLRRLRDNFAVARKRAKEDPSDKNKALYRKWATELNSREMEVYSSRCERYPNHLGFKYELAVRLQRAGKIPEAIKAFQEARSDPQRKGNVLLQLGKCFEAIKQHKLAMANFEESLEHIPERHEDSRKEAMYSIAKLALETKDLDAAEKQLNALAGIDFTYRDVPDLLEKHRKLKEEED